MKRRLTITDIYNSSPLKERIEWATYKLVWSTFTDLLMSELMDTGKCFKLPHVLGTLQIRKTKVNLNKKPIDFHKTKLYGMTIYHQNKHSDGYYGRIYWNKEYPQASFTNKKIFQIEFTRANKRKLSHTIKNSNSINKYFEL